MRLISRSSAALVGAVMILSTFTVAPVFAAAVDAVDDGTALAPFQFFPEDAPATAVDVINNDLGCRWCDIRRVDHHGQDQRRRSARSPSTPDSGRHVPPNADASAADSFTYTVTDGVTTDTATVFVSVNALNDAPSFTLATDPTVAEDSGAGVIEFAIGSGGPSNESAQTLTYVIDSNSNAALFSAAPAISPAGTLTFTPAANANGSATIVVHVVDNGPNGGGDVNFSPTADVPHHRDRRQ